MDAGRLGAVADQRVHWPHDHVVRGDDRVRHLVDDNLSQASADHLLHVESSWTVQGGAGDSPAASRQANRLPHLRHPQHGMAMKALSKYDLTPATCKTLKGLSDRRHLIHMR